MPRDLGDVIHYFIAEAGAPGPGTAAPRRETRRTTPNPGHVVGLPILEGDVFRAAFAWNLSVELARAGATAHLVAPREEGGNAAWPAAGTGPLGAGLELSKSTDGASLAQRAATADAVAADAADGRPARRDRCTLACIPESELESACASPAAPQQWLLLCSPSASSLRHTRDLALRLGSGGARIGATIHGVRSMMEAQEAFDALDAATSAALAHPIQSYGLIADDLHLYRAIVASRPIGLAHPQSPAARALADVANLLLGDLRETTDV